MILTSFDIFEGGIAIGQFSANRDQLQWYINRYEPVFMSRYIGAENYDRMKTDIGSSNPDTREKAEKLWSICAYPCAIYIWCHYTCETQQHRSGSGNVEMSNENSSVSDSSGVIVRKWNEMASLTSDGQNVLLSEYNIHAGKFDLNNTWI